MQTLKDGICNIHKKTYVSDAGSGKVQVITPYINAWYEDINIFTSEYYGSDQSYSKVDRRIRILQDKTLSDRNVVVINGEQYSVGRVWHGIENGTPVTEISLALITTKFTEVKV